MLFMASSFITTLVSQRQWARHATAIAGAALALQCSAGLAATPAKPAAAASPAGVLRWDLADIYATPAAWDTAYTAVKARAEALAGLQAGMGSNAASFLKALVTISDVQRDVYRLYTYAKLKADEDLRFAPAQERSQQAQALATVLDEKIAWAAPAIQALGAERVNAFIAAEPELKKRFDFYLKDTLRSAAHTLSPEGEGLLAASGTVLAQPNNIYQQLAEAELPRSKVRLANGKTVTLTQDAYEVHRRSPVRADRKAVFDSFFGSWKSFEGSFGANLATQVQGNIFTARSRKFGGSLEAALFGSDMPPAVYRTLVEQANAGLPALHRYLKLRKQVLGVKDTLAYYDNYPALAKPSQAENFNVETSKAITLQALAPMGDEYLGLLKKGFASTWMDSHPRTAKQSGAYVMGSAYDVHPYVLLNHSDDFESLSTFAHEWGHAVHTLLANAAQPYEKASYSTFIAESASIINEMLLSDHMVANAKTRQDKLFYLANAMESIRTTFFRQTMFAEFQLAMHEEVEKGQPLSGKRLSELYCGVAKRYYGEAQGVMKIDPAYCIEWAYISHFYYGYYVWQYATSMVGAAQFTEAIQKEGAPARDRFITLLKAGGSDFPYPLYKTAGIDLAQPAPYQALMARMNRLMDEFERLSKPGAALR
jgi:oligoendopeptidase F